MNPLTKAVSAVGRSLKAFTMVFGRATGRAWTYTAGRTRRMLSRYVGDGTTNNIVVACINWACRTFPEAPIIVLRRGAEGSWEADDDHPFVELMERPNPFYSGTLLLNATIRDLFGGEAFWLKIRAEADNVLQYWWVPRTMMTPKRPEDGSEFISHYDYNPDGRTEPIRMDTRNVVHFRWGLDPDNPMRGLSPFGSLLKEIFTDEEAANFTSSVLHNMGVPGVVISPGDKDVEIESEDADSIRDNFDRRFTSDGRGGTAVLSKKADVKVLSWSPKEMDLTALRRIPEERITAVLGIPAIVAGLGAGLDRSTFSNFKEAREAAYESFIIPLQQMFAADLKAQALEDFGDTKGVRIAFDLSQVRVLQDDQDALVKRLAEGVRGGFVMIAEARTKIGLPVQDSDWVYLRYFAQAEVAMGASANEAEVLPDPKDPLALPAPKSVEWKSRESERREKACARAMRTFLRAQATRIASRYRNAKSTDVSDETKASLDELFKGEADALARLLTGFELDAASSAGSAANSTLGIDDPYEPSPKLTRRIASDIKGIDKTTRAMVQIEITAGRGAGLTRAEIADNIKASGAFMDSRAEMIARTELAKAENLGQVDAWRASDVVTGVEISDGDQDDECASANGATWTLDEFEANPLGHPNCTRVGIPVVKD